MIEIAILGLALVIIGCTDLLYNRLNNNIDIIPVILLPFGLVIIIYSIIGEAL